MGGMGGASNKIIGGDGGGGAINILMPMYTVGILLFFVYTMMKVINNMFVLYNSIICIQLK